MIDAVRSPDQQVVTVFGGSGFLGRYVVSALARRGYRVLVPTRQPSLGNLLPLGRVGQIHSIACNLRQPDSVARAVAKADHVINLVGLLKESGRQTFEALHEEGLRVIAAAVPRHASLIHVSALGADTGSESRYARSKARGEAALLAARPDAVILRPSVLFGPGDGLFTRFAVLSRILPILPLVGADTRLQPVYAGDVAEAVARAVGGLVPGGRIYELGGPAIKTVREVMDYVLEVTERSRMILPIPAPIGRLQGSLMGSIDTVLMGLLPEAFSLTRDQAILLERDNVVSDAAAQEGRTLDGLSIVPTSIEAIVPPYLIRFRKTGQFDLKRNTSTTQPVLPTSAGHGGPFHADGSGEPSARL